MPKHKTQKCLNPCCNRSGAVRGLCSPCYAIAARLVTKGLTTWRLLEEGGKCLSSKRDKSATKGFLSK